MKDEELTTLAAKAFGNAPNGFSPLTDDGDALRLAVKFKLNVDLAYEEECVVRVFNEAHFFSESTAQDPFAATRRAIVRAAAEIGKAMP